MKSFRVLAVIAVAVGLLLSSACSAAEQFAFITAIKQEAKVVSRQSGPSDAAMARLAHCESTDNPKAVSPNGKYFGLYQFDQRTWNGVAASVMPRYVGVRPSNAPPEVQTALARALHAARGRSPWPVCGRLL